MIPPDYFQPWEHPLLPSDAASPTDFKQVRIWRNGKIDVVDPTEVDGPFEDVYWQPVDAVSARTHLN